MKKSIKVRIESKEKRLKGVICVFVVLNYESVECFTCELNSVTFLPSVQFDSFVKQADNTCPTN